MINKEKNTRIAITLPKKQVEWLQNFCKERKITTSQFIKFMLVKTVNELCDMWNLRDNETLQEMIRIAQTKWLDEDW